MKLTINKLIANDFINYAIDQTESDNSIVYLNSYLKDFEEEDKNYILNNIDSIKEDITNHESVLDLEISHVKNDIEFNIIFYWDKLLSDVEKRVADTAKLMKVELDYHEVKELTNGIIDDDEFNDDLIGKLKNYKKEMELS